MITTQSTIKRAVSISLGSSKRDSSTVVELFGEKVQLERIGTDGDMKKAEAMYSELDGKVDAFGVGGALLGFMVDTNWHTLHSVQSLIKGVHKTPVADGTGLKMTLERKAASVLAENVNIPDDQKHAFMTSAVDRYGLFQGFNDAGYQCVIGDVMFALGMDIPLNSEKSLKRMVSILMPVISRLPFSMLYPTGESQNKRTPKWGKYFTQADVVAGDCHYLTKYMPDHMEGKTIVTNTTTKADRDLFKQAGVKYLITTTPVFEERSYGTNMLEAGLLAATGRQEPVDYAHAEGYLKQVEAWLDELNIKPQFTELS